MDKTVYTRLVNDIATARRLSFSGGAKAKYLDKHLYRCFEFVNFSNPIAIGFNYGRYIICFIILAVYSFESPAQVKNLDFYVNHALANSPVLKENYIKQQQNSLDSAIELTDYLPQVSANAIGWYAPMYGQYGYDQTITNGGEYAALISVSQQISPHREIMLKRMLSTDERSALSADSKVKENEIRREVTDNYLKVCLLQQQLKYYYQSDSFLIRQDTIVKALTEKGLYKISDYIELMVEEKSERTQIGQMVLDLSQAYSELDVICGIKDSVQYKLSIPDIAPIRQTDVTQLAEYQQFHADSISLAEQAKLVDAGYHPKLSWYADAGILASQPNLIYRSIGNSAGLNLSIPIYDGNKKKLKLQNLHLSDETRSDYQSYFITNYTTRNSFIAKQIEDVRQLLIQLREEEQQIRHWIEIDQSELAAGNIPVTDFLMSLKKNLEVKNAINETLIKQQSLQNEFNYWNH